MEQTLNETQPSQAGAGSDEPASAMPQAATTGLAVIVDLAAQAVRFSVTMVLVLSLAGTLCLGLILSARQFSRTARASREAVQRSASIRSQSERLRSIARTRETVSQREPLREQLLREIDAASRQLDVRKLTALRGQLQALLEPAGTGSEQCVQLTSAPITRSASVSVIQKQKHKFLNS